MGADNLKSKPNHKSGEGKFNSKHIKKDPQAQSARDVFGLHEDNPKNKSSHTSR